MTPDDPALTTPPQRDEPLALEPDDDDEQHAFHRPKRIFDGLAADDPNMQTSIDLNGSASMASPLPRVSAPPKALGEAFRWALDALQHPAMAAADWLARDIDPSASSATALLTSPSITLAQVRQAKTVFKTMRIVGEKSADRRVGARMYAAAIAAGLVRHGKRISTQSDSALRRGFHALLDDRRMPQSLRDLAGMAVCVLDDRQRGTK